MLTTLSVLDLLLRKTYLWLPSLTLLSLLYKRYCNGLRHVPGPFMASFSNLWKLYAAWQEDMPEKNVAVHERYGPVVRTGQRTVSCSDPSALPVIYSFKAWDKSAFYPLFEALYQGKPTANLITTRNTEYHFHLKRATGNAYAMGSAMELESSLNMTIETLLERIGEVTEAGKRPLDTSAWLQYFAFDAMGELNFSNQFGFLETGADMNACGAAIGVFIYYGSMIGQIPWVHKFLLGNPLLPKLLPQLEAGNNIQNLILWNIEKRQRNPHIGKRDILARFLEEHEKDSSKLSFREIVGLMTTNLVAGSGVVAIALRAILYYLCHNPSVHAKLTDEVAKCKMARSTSGIISYVEASKLEFLSAVINESLRVHSPTGLIFERMVPAGGAVVSGVDLPEGTKVGVNSWVLHRNKQVFGQDADMYRPERWIEAPPHRLAEMKRCMIAFGTGPRACVGKNIALMELFKVTAELIWHFDIKLAHPEKKWKVVGHWFTEQTDLDMIFTKRQLQEA